MKNYLIKDNADIEIVAYDMLGNKFALLENTNKEAGDHKLDWISKDIPSGIYMIVFNMNGDAIISEKVIINK